MTARTTATVDGVYLPRTVDGVNLQWTADGEIDIGEEGFGGERGRGGPPGVGRAGWQGLRPAMGLPCERQRHRGWRSQWACGPRKGQRRQICWRGSSWPEEADGGDGSPIGGSGRKREEDDGSIGGGGGLTEEEAHRGGRLWVWEKPEGRRVWENPEGRRGCSWQRSIGGAGEVAGGVAVTTTGDGLSGIVEDDDLGKKSVSDFFTERGGMRNSVALGKTKRNSQ